MLIISLQSATGLCPKLCRLGLEGVLSKDSCLVLETIPLEFVPRLVDASAVRLPIICADMLLCESVIEMC